MTPPSPRHCIAHYDEIALKGRNRVVFENLAMNHLRRLLNPFGLDHIRKPRGRFILQFKENTPWRDIIPGIQKVFGITNFSPVYKTLPNLDALKNSLSQSLESQSFKSFGITTRRPNKQISLSSQEIKIEMGSFVAEKTHAKVDLEKPDCWLEIEVDEEASYYSFKKFEGPGGR